MTEAFEAAVHAIIAGEIDTLAALLRATPSLVVARAARPHQATLLHYVSANGVEDALQRTPPNIVDIARLLLDAGADVNATCDAYGGGATTLGLTVTSAHPRAAGVQEALAQLLLARGATIDEHIVYACLMNGCPEAAEFMAHEVVARGGTLRLDEAAGLGRTDLVHAALATHPANDPLIASASNLAEWYGHDELAAHLRAKQATPPRPKDPQ